MYQYYQECLNVITTSGNKRKKNLDLIAEIEKLASYLNVTLNILRTMKKLYNVGKKPQIECSIPIDNWNIRSLNQIVKDHTLLSDKSKQKKYDGKEQKIQELEALIVQYRDGINNKEFPTINIFSNVSNHTKEVSKIFDLLKNKNLNVCQKSQETTIVTAKDIENMIKQMEENNKNNEKFQFLNKEMQYNAIEPNGLRNLLYTIEKKVQEKQKVGNKIMRENACKFDYHNK